MKETILVIDIRYNQYTAGLFTVDDLSWYTQSIFQVYKDGETGIRDATSVVDLSFFCRLNEQWSPIEPAALKALDSDSFESIEVLFEEPHERLEDILPVTLGRLLQDTIKQYKNVSQRLMLVERPEIRDILLQGKFGKALEKVGMEVFVPGQWGELEGFALAFYELGPNRLPDDGMVWYCEFEDPSEKKKYTWYKGRFVAETGEEFGFSEQYPSSTQWKSASELERMGATLLAHVWQKPLVQALDEQIAELEERLREDVSLLNRMREIYEYLRPDKLSLKEYAT